MRTGIAHKVSAAIAVRWTPALATRVARRIERRLVARRHRRRLAVVTLVLLGAASAGYAFTHRWTHRAPNEVVAAPSAHAAPLMVPAPPPTAAPPAAAAPVPAPPSASAVPPRRRPAIRSVASARGPARPETVDALFAAADASRLAGRPADSVAPLTAIFTRHPDDPRAAIAAYQLGRVWALDLHDAAQAAAAFTRAHDLDPRGPLAADAAAHAAEARRTAGGAAP